MINRIPLEVHKELGHAIKRFNQACVEKGKLTKEEVQIFRLLQKAKMQLDNLIMRDFLEEGVSDLSEIYYGGLK